MRILVTEGNNDRRHSRRPDLFGVLVDQMYGHNTPRHAENKIGQQGAEYIEEIVKHHAQLLFR